MAADEISRETAEVKFQGASCGVDSRVDMRGHDMSETALGAAGSEGNVEFSCDREDVGDSTSEGLDGAMGFKNCVIVDDGAFRSSFLIGEDQQRF
jgi:hypothetical protein